MDLVQAITTNGAVRAFQLTSVDDAALARVLDCARFAPSGGNKQGWHVIVVKDPAIRSQIETFSRMGWNEYAALTSAGVRPFAADETGHWPGPPPGVDLAHERLNDRPWPFIDDLANVPVLLVVAVDLRVVAAVDAQADRIGIAGGGSIYPFVQNILLAARSEALAGVMTTFLVRQEPAAQQLLGLPKHMAIAALVALGVPQHQNSKLRRKAVHEFATVDRYDGAPFGQP
jgi:nitroreductase